MIKFTEEQKRYLENDVESLCHLVMKKNGRKMYDYEKMQFKKEYNYSDMLTDYQKLQIEKEYKTSCQIKSLDIKKLIVDAIIGCGNIKSYHNTRYCKYVGNQWNGNFEWVREQLEIQTLEVLVDMYSFLIIK